MKDILNEIKWAHQRVVRGYDDRIFWGFDGYFADFIPPLKQFCENYLKHDYVDLNPERKEVMLETLRLIDEYEKDEFNFNNVLKRDKPRLWAYFGEHIDWYWD